MKAAVAEKQEMEALGVIDEAALFEAIEAESELMVGQLMDEECPIDDDICTDEGKFSAAREKLKGVIGRTLGMVRTGDATGAEEAASDDIFGDSVVDGEVPLLGEILERGWEKRGNSSSLRRNAEVWKFALNSVLKVLGARKLRTKGEASEEEISAAKIEAGEYIRDGCLKLGPTFVKLAQVASTRTDVLPEEIIDALKTLQDDVPGFSGRRAREIVTKELGKRCDRVFADFSDEPIAAASLGQVHTAKYKGKDVAVKVQRAGLKELFDVDLKNLRKLAELLDKFDPKTDGADRDWVSIYEESARLLYLEIDYLNEAANTERFAKDFSSISWVRVPGVYREASTPRVLTMEFVDSFKLTDLQRIDDLGIDRKVLSKHVADAFLRQIIETGYFHCDPHPGNMCCDTDGNLVFYDYGMMDELRPNVRSGFRTFCGALFSGGPMVDDLTLAKNAKSLVDGVEEAGVLARGADRLAVEKLARFFMRAFKDNQLGKGGSSGVKQTVGVDLQTLTESDVFRFPSTFTFVSRSFASIDGIGKGLDSEFDIGKLAQPFIEKFTEEQKGYASEGDKRFKVFAKATGLNPEDINTAITTPRKIAYVEETLRAMEEGTLKIRVRSLENEKALERMALTQGRERNILLLSVMLNLAGLAGGPILRIGSLAGAGFFGLQAFTTNTKIAKFDKTQAKFVQTTFEGEE